MPVPDAKDSASLGRASGIVKTRRAARLRAGAPIRALACPTPPGEDCSPRRRI